MTAALIVLALVALAALYLLRDKDKRHTETLHQLSVEWAAERSELLTRIQRPEYVPPPQQSFKQPAPPKDAAELARVGTVLPFRDGDE
jgi:hypothetical protein